MVEESMAYYSWDEIVELYNALYFVDGQFKMEEEVGDILTAKDIYRV